MGSSFQKGVAGALSTMLLCGGAVGGYAINEKMKTMPLTIEETVGQPKQGDQTKQENKEQVVKTGAKIAQNSNSAKQLMKENESKVAYIQVRGLHSDRVGSGFLYNTKGDIITNAHVVDDAYEIIVKMWDGKQGKGEVIGINTDKDIALVRVPELVGRTPMKVDAETKADAGEQILALGNPYGYEKTVTPGLVSGIREDKGNSSYLYQISASVSPGNSGGPLVRLDNGAAIGIVSAQRKDDNNVSFSIPLTQVMPMFQQWSAHPQKRVQENRWREQQASESIPSLQAVPAEKVLEVVVSRANVRSAPSLYSSVLTLIERGTIVDSFEEAIDKNGEIWYHIRSGERGIDGWVNERTVSETEGDV